MTDATLADLQGYGREQAEHYLARRNQAQFQFWEGWCAALARVRAVGVEQMDEAFKRYRRKGISELRPYVVGEDLTGVSVSKEDAAAGSPKVGDWIARNPNNHEDRWLMAAQYFIDAKLEPVAEIPVQPPGGHVE